MAFIPNVVDGQIILASWGNSIRDQTVSVFASAAERTSQWPSPPTGALSWRNDAQCLEEYYSGAWSAPRVNGIATIGAIVPSGATVLTLRDPTTNSRITVGAEPGTGTTTSTTVGISGDNANNAWNALPLSVNHGAGAGAPGIGLGNFGAGFAHSLLANAAGMHVRNSNDTAYSSIAASAFPVNCSRLHKINIKPLAGMAKLMEKICPVSFDDIRTGRLDGTVEPNHRYGFTAEEVAEVFPDLCRGEGRDMTVDQTGLISVLWQAVKELTARVNVLETA